MYRIRSVELIRAELDYNRENIIKAEETLEKLENRGQYLRSELKFNLEKGNKSAEFKRDET